MNLGNALKGKGWLDEAIACYQKSLRHKPDDFRVHSELGDALRAKGRLDEAIACHREALRLKPDEAGVQHNLGVALAAKGRLDEAIACYNEAIRLQPDLDLAHNNLAWLLATCPDSQFRDPDRAVELARKAVELAPTEGGNWNTLGVAEYRAGAWDQAIEALTKSMELTSGGSPADWFFLALAHDRRGESDQARSWYNKAVAWMDENQSRDEELLRFRAEAMERLGERPLGTGDEVIAPPPC